MSIVLSLLLLQGFIRSLKVIGMLDEDNKRPHSETVEVFGYEVIHSNPNE